MKEGRGCFSEQFLKGEGRLPKGKGKRFSQNKTRKKERKKRSLLFIFYAPVFPLFFLVQEWENDVIFPFFFLVFDSS